MDKAEAADIFRAAAEQALRAFPIDARALELVSASENIAYRVTSATGDDYVLRLHRPGYHTLPELQSERMWTRALAGSGIGAPVPVSTCEGAEYVCVRVDGLGQDRQAGMSQWAPGELLADVLSDADLPELVRRFEQIGALQASMHNHSSEWTLPRDFTRHSLDADGLMGEAPFWGPFWDHPAFSSAERRLVMGTRDRIHAVLRRLGRDRSDFGLIHADLHPGNILVDGERLRVIDFDDSGFGWHSYDIAVTLVNWQSSPHFHQIQQALVRGYRTRRAICDEALALIPLFLLARSLAQIGWLHQRPEIDASSRIQRLKQRACASCAAYTDPF